LPSSLPPSVIQTLDTWRHDPAAFAVGALGVTPWSRQRDILAAVADDTNTRIAVRAGHKVSKSNSAALVAIWWAIFGGRVIILAPTERQVKEVIWRELRLMKQAAPYPLGGDLARDPGTGWRFPGEAQIIGFSTDEPERLGGFSGRRLLFIVDEGSGVDDVMFEAIEGNMAGGARLVMIGNPTRITGQFHRAFHSERHLWKLLHLPSTASPNVTGERQIPGLATPAWVEDMARKWGAESNLYRVRVLGEFPESEDDAMIPLAWIEEAVQRYRDMQAAGTLPPPDRLALDVATGVGRDAGVVAVCGGNGCLALESSTEADTMEQTGRMYQGHRAGLILRVDGDGPGAGVVHRLRELGATVESFQGGEGVEDTVTDESGELTFANRISWAYWRVREMLDPRAGLSVFLPPDEMLIEDLAAVRYKTLSSGKIQREPKDVLRKRLGRSPDKGDAVVMGLAADSAPSPAEWVAASMQMLRASQSRR